MILFEYKCHEHGLFESLSTISDRDNPRPCPECGDSAPRVQSAPRFKLDPISGDFPTAYDAWTNMRDKQVKRERKLEAEHGEDYYK